MTMAKLIRTTVSNCVSKDREGGFWLNEDLFYA